MIDNVLLEYLIIKGCYSDNNYLTMVTSVFKPEYFDDAVIGSIFGEISKHFQQYQMIIPESTLTSDKDKRDIFDEIRSIDFDVAKNYDYLYQETENYLKEKAVKTAILDSVDVVNKKEEIGKIRGILENAMCKSLKVNLGLEYWKNIGERLRIAFTDIINRIPSYFPQLDEYINGGFPPYTLNVCISRVHGFKSAFLANVSARQVLSGKNIVIMSLEMSEKMYAQRYDGIYSGLNINKMYIDPELRSKLIKSLAGKAAQENKGNLYIKEFPPGKASVQDFRMYMRELEMHHIKIDAMFCDYINLMKPSNRPKKDLYMDVKEIAEELRAMGLEFNCPVISVTQLNREGSDDIELSSLDIVHISESLGLAATSDSLFIFGNESNMRTYENELHYKILKNRLGGRVGEINKFFIDSNSLTMYDVTELDKWRSDSLLSGDNRKLKDRKVNMPRGLGKKSKRSQDE